MAEELGIAQTEELLVGMTEVAILVAQAVKVGGKPNDIAASIAAAVVSNPEAIAALKRAVDGIGQVPAELRDISLPEALRLCEISLVNVRRALAALKPAA